MRGQSQNKNFGTIDSMLTNKPKYIESSYKPLQQQQTRTNLVQSGQKSIQGNEQRSKQEIDSAAKKEQVKQNIRAPMSSILVEPTKDCSCSSKEQLGQLTMRLQQMEAQNAKLIRDNLKLKIELCKAQQQQQQQPHQLHEGDELYSLMISIKMQEREERQAASQKYHEFMKEAMTPLHNSDPNYANTDDMTYEQLLELQDKVGHVSRGLTAEQIRKIPQLNVTQAIANRLPDQCSVCFSQFQVNEKYRRLNCNHFYHSPCIEQWLSNEKKCPICKEEVQL